ncbi:MAG: serine/threonine protein kinase [Myxococcota bacterium]|nr:serine/threonine protein kinase [Myxococcota bacterium]
MADLLLARATGTEGIEGFERHVVIKRIRAEQAGDQRFVQMFLDEARLAASLHHHHIAHVHDIGQDAGDYFFAMEYVHGEDLRKLLMLVNAREQYVPLDHVVTIVLAAASALHYAHNHTTPDRQPLGIVHRDVSPANILVGYDGNVKVVDFGIAKAALRTTETQSGLMKGKVAYMSPEQCVGQPVDRRSDIFCLGIVLYELATVRRLFKGANDFLTMSAITHGRVPAPTEIRPGLPRELEAIILKALAHDPDDRFETAEEMRVALEQFAIANGLRMSTTALAGYMRSLFGEKQEPWLIEDDAPEDEISIDFDGSATGIVGVPAAAAARFAVPTSTPVQPSSPIMKARTKAITDSPPSLAPPVRTEPEREIDHAVGDVTTMVRPATVTSKLHKRLAIGVGTALVFAVIVAVVSNLRTSAPSPVETPPPAPSVTAGDIRLPPPSTVDVQPAAPPTADVQPAADAPSADAQAPAKEPPALVKLRDDDGTDPSSKAVTRRKHPRRSGLGPTTPPADAAPAPAWDPNALFPKQ